MKNSKDLALDGLCSLHLFFKNALVLQDNRFYCHFQWMNNVAGFQCTYCGIEFECATA